MYAITAKEIGEAVGIRSIKQAWELAEGETFKVESIPENAVLAEDGRSLRSKTSKELSDETKAEEKKKEETEPRKKRFDELIKLTPEKDSTAALADSLDGAYGAILTLFGLLEIDINSEELKKPLEKFLLVKKTVEKAQVDFPKSKKGK